MSNRYRYMLLSVFGWLALANSHPNIQGGQQSGQVSSLTRTLAKPNLVKTKANDAIEQGCKGTDQPEISCDAIAAQAAINQATLASYQTFLGGLTLIAAGAAAIFAWLAAYHTKRGSDLSEKALRSVQRASVGVVRFNTGAHSRNEEGEVTGILCEVIWKNQGPTPALNVAMAIGYQMVENIGDAVFVFDEPDPDIGSGTIEPGVERFTHHVHIPIKDLWDVWSNKRKALVFSECSYDDVFSIELKTPRHVSKVCGEINLPAPPSAIGTPSPYFTNFRMVGPFNGRT